MGYSISEIVGKFDIPHPMVISVYFGIPNGIPNSNSIMQYVIGPKFPKIRENFDKCCGHHIQLT